MLLGNYYNINGIDYECVGADKKEVIFEAVDSGNWLKMPRSNFNRMLKSGEIEELY